MEGTLLKWTNYWNGWQPRWFVLKNGVLSYYNSQNDTNSGCKRSFKISMFDIIVNRTDSTRMDLIVANDQHLYLKACDYRERQKWLVAIATQKASYPNSTNEQQYVYQSNNLLKCKQSELRLYCDLLMQQIHEMKNLVNTEKLPQNEAKKIEEIHSNVNVTCEMLMNIVKNIIVIFENQNQHQLTNISGVNLNQQNNNNNNLDSLKEMLNDNLVLNYQTTTTSATSLSCIDDDPTTSTTKRNNSITNANDIFNERKKNSIKKSNSYGTSSTLINTLLSHNIHLTSSKLLVNDADSFITHKRESSLVNSCAISTPPITTVIDSDQVIINKEEEVFEEAVEEDKMKKSDHRRQFSHQKIDTTQQQNQNGHYEHRSFFTKLEHRFEDFRFFDSDQIPTEEFLNCCREVFKILDIFGSTTFLPVKVDVTGNLNKISQKYTTNPKKYHSLQAIVQSEIDDNQTTVRNSATDALLWLKRGIWFLRQFFYYFAKKNSSMSDSIHMAYTKTLKQYHNWVVRGIFSLALRSVPGKENFLACLSVDPNDFYNNPEGFEKQISNDISRMLIILDKVLNSLNTFYSTKKLDEDNPIVND